MIAAALLFLATILILGTRVPHGAPNAAPSFAVSIVTDGWAPLAWMVSALGLGSLVRSERFAVRLGAGVALLLAIDQFAGSLGAFASPFGGWIVLAPGALLAARDAASRLRPEARERFFSALGRAWPLAPGIAALLLAATSSPGFLWSTEYAGYDALSYHLALPRVWLESGALSPVAWNAYSSLPSWVEGAYMHCFALGGDPTLMGIRAQLLHALITIAALMLTGEAAERALDDGRGESALPSGSARLLATAALLSAPWIVVTGSLAYNEAGAMLGAAGIMAVWFARGVRAPRRGLLLGLFAACMVGSKLSAGVIVLPALLTLCGLVRPGPGRASIASVLIAVPVAAFLLSPWLLRNAMATGNPVFPFAASILGAHDWGPEQVATWNRAHAAQGGVRERLAALWWQFGAFGFGAPPSPDERWRPFMGLLPWLALAGALAGAMGGSTRRLALSLLAALAVGLASWLLWTHMKSRFLVPLLPIAALLAALGFEVLMRRLGARGRPRRAAPFVVALLMALAPAAALFTDGPFPSAMIGAERVMTGDALADLLADPATRAAAQRLDRSRAFVLNHEIAPEARRLGLGVLLVGDATTFRYRVPLRASTVWTRDPLVERWLAAAEQGAESGSGTPSAAGAEAARAVLRDASIGWVLVDPVMLQVWSRSGWLDPALSSDRLRRAMATLEPLRRFDDGALLLRVGADTVMRPQDESPTNR